MHIIVTNYGLLVFCPEKLSVTWWYVFGLWGSGSSSGKRCLDRIVRILLISLTVLIVSMFFISIQCMHVFYTVLADVLYCICMLY